MIDQSMVASARSSLEKLRSKCSDVFSKIMCAYNLGALYWTHIGDGDKAKQYYKEVTGYYENKEMSKEYYEHQVKMTANCYENLMLLSLSHDEFSEFTEKLRKIQPNNHILKELVPEISRLIDDGFSWAEIMEILTQNYYNRSNPALDNGRYGNAASSFQMIISRRKEFRISQEAINRIAIEFGYCRYQLVKRIISIHEKAFKGLKLNEFMFIFDDAISLIESCFTNTKAEPDTQRVIDSLKLDRDELNGLRNQKQTAPQGGQVKNLVDDLINEANSMGPRDGPPSYSSSMHDLLMKIVKCDKDWRLYAIKQAGGIEDGEVCQMVIGDITDGMYISQDIAEDAIMLLADSDEEIHWYCLCQLSGYFARKVSREAFKYAFSTLYKKAGRNSLKEAAEAILYRNGFGKIFGRWV